MPVCSGSVDAFHAATRPAVTLATVATVAVKHCGRAAVLPGGRQREDVVDLDVGRGEAIDLRDGKCGAAMPMK
jgi:hypothetical protein